MRVALISDVHANIDALDAALARIDTLGVDHVYCLGDIVGYHADAEPCIKRLRERGVRSLAGNHDRAVAGLRSAASFGARARRGVNWTRQELGPESLDFLAALPVAELAFGQFFAVHAALHPEPNDELHLSTRARVRASLVELASGRFGAELCFFGHTHRAAVHRLVCGRVESRIIDGEREVSLSANGAQLVNPGSLGQPRDGDPRAAFAVYDTATHSVSFQRVAYDWRACHERARRAGLFEGEERPPKSSALLAQLDAGARLVRRALGRVSSGS